MNKQEFEERIKESISEQNYKIIETVYNYHPSISEVNGKDQIANLYEIGGMALIRSMLEIANIMNNLEKEKSRLMCQMNDICRRIDKVSNGDVSEEQCRRDASDLFDTISSPTEWNEVKSFLTIKYDTKMATEIIKEIETC